MNAKSGWIYQQSYPKWSQRKKEILDWFRNSEYGWIVNCKHTVQLNDRNRLAKDLRRLVKEGILVQSREWYGRSRKTVLKLK